MPDFLDIILEAKGAKKASKAKPAPKPKDDEEDDAPTDYSADAGSDDAGDDSADDADAGDDTGSDAGDDDTPTDYSADDVDVDPNETGSDDAGDDSADDADAGDDTGSDTGDGSEDDSGDGGDEATDYSDDGTGSDDPAADGTEPSDGGQTPEQQAEATQNNDLLNDFSNLYYTCKNTILKLSNLSKDNIVINKIVSQVMTNLMQLKNMLYDYIVYTFANSKYVGNLYKYGLFIQAFKINLEMLKKISVLLPN